MTDAMRWSGAGAGVGAALGLIVGLVVGGLAAAFVERQRQPPTHAGPPGR
jgi:hypothetical protein